MNVSKRLRWLFLIRYEIYVLLPHIYFDFLTYQYKILTVSNKLALFCNFNRISLTKKIKTVPYRISISILNALIHNTWNCNHAEANNAENSINSTHCTKMQFVDFLSSALAIITLIIHQTKKFCIMSMCTALYKKCLHAKQNPSSSLDLCF